LQVQESVERGGVTKSWLFRYTRTGVSREMGLGPLHTIGLAEARNRAQEARKLLLDGKDPIEVRDAAKAGIRLAAANSQTFRKCAEAYIKAQSPSWRNAKHAAQWSSTLETYAYPVIGSMAVALVETPHVVRVLEPIWATKTETATRLRGRIELILSWAKVMGYRDGENPARWRGHLDHTLARISKQSRVKHHEALPFDQAPAFLKELRKRPATAARALEFLILTAARTSEVIGGRKSEIDRDTATWTIPADEILESGKRRGMKAGKEHRVPLVDRALELLDELDGVRGTSEQLFPSQGGGELSNMAMLNVLKRMKRDDITVHGFRSTFRDWAAEKTNFPKEVVEMALAHTIENEVEAAYRRGDLFEKRRELMEAWAAFLEKEPATVTALDAKRRRSKAAA
jgi:integrase